MILLTYQVLKKEIVLYLYKVTEIFREALEEIYESSQIRDPEYDSSG